LAYIRGQGQGNGQNTELAWYDRSGKRIGVAAPLAEYRNPGLSADGKYVVFERGNPGDIWVLDLLRGVPQRLTTRPADDVFPVWSPDGQKVAFASEDGKSPGLYLRAFGVVANDELLAKTDVVGPDDWSHDGRYVVFDSYPPKRHIWAVPLSGK